MGITKLKVISLAVNFSFEDLQLFSFNRDNSHAHCLEQQTIDCQQFIYNHAQYLQFQIRSDLNLSYLALSKCFSNSH
jgi:hypothetical protein